MEYTSGHQSMVLLIPVTGIRINIPEVVTGNKITQSIEFQSDPKAVF
jgi:hypothetical protein